MLLFRASRALVICRFLPVAAVLCLASVSSATPVDDGLVLWLDAHDPDTLSPQSGGAISVWTDKSGQGNHAKQVQPGSQPQYLSDGFRGKPAIRFDGDDFLNLGRPASLDFRPGDPFTILVAYRVSQKITGMFLAKGGGAAADRAYQLYLSQGKIGSITFGAMKEKSVPVGAGIAVQVCDGSRATVHWGGEPCFSFTVGDGPSACDVLVGARRDGADNTGVRYMLKGDVAEILVFNRALSEAEHNRLGCYLQKKHSLDATSPGLEELQELVDEAKPSGPFADLTALAPVVARNGDDAVTVLRALLDKGSVEAAVATAEILLFLSEKGQLGSAYAVLAAGLLGHDDPFVSAIAEWALATKVAADNNGQQIVWPCADPPEWFNTWSGLTPDFMLEADYVRSAVGRGLHHDAAGLVASVAEIRGRAGGAASEILPTADPETRAMVSRRLDELDDVDRRAAAHLEASPGDLVGLRRLWLRARRAARPVVLANPAVDFDRLLFVKRYPAHSHRNITGSQYPWAHKPGGDVYLQEGLDPGGTVRPVIAGRLGPGHVHGIDLWWDADRVVFGYARQPDWPPPWDAVEGNHVFLLRGQQEPTHLFEIGLDGSGPRQLTNHPHWSDLEPTYCANGDVVFASGRSGRSSECGKFSADHTVVNLYAVSPDGKNVRRLSDNKDIDRYPHSLDNGTIGYTRWEYQERHFYEVHAIWTVRPDGTMSDAVFNQHMKAPFGFRDTRSIPGSSKLVSIATGHHTFAYGPVVVVDPRRGISNTDAIRIVTPNAFPQEGPMAGSPVSEGGVPDRGGLYQTPWALSETCFLVSYSHARVPSGTNGGDNTNGFALYLIDVYGNKELVHRDPLLSCAFPIPLRKRRRPPVLPNLPDRLVDYATCYVGDVHQGLEGIPPGTVKYIRIMQRVGWPLDSKIGAMRWISGSAGSKKRGVNAWAPVRVVGTVPVQNDGSAYFKAPVDTAVYFQALDENHMEIRRMRSHVTFQPGETRGCLGCHETRARTPADHWQITAALQRQPVTPEPPDWGTARLLGYEWLVQPILDRHCVRCHGAEEPDGGLDFTGTRAPDGYCQSFRTMFGALPSTKEPGRVLVSCSDRFSGASVSQPKEFGSHRSPLIRVLLDDELHKEEVKLGRREWIALVTWVDANAPYFDTFFNRRPKDNGQPRRDVLLEFPDSLTLGNETGTVHNPNLARRP
ncbi:MAG: hypothetical protein HQ582_24675 [Planctomycetes bacterium]|nr:hypothetical protein [Planctomycetota bacterium]